MTTLYYVRHARPDFSCHNDATRPLTAQGHRDTARVTAWLADKDISAVYSSPYLRAVDTIKPFAAHAGLPVHREPDLRERTVTDDWIEDFDSYSRRQWADFEYALPGGESLNQVQRRGLEAVRRILSAHPGQSVALAGHGTALCALLASYLPGFGYHDFQRMKNKMPWGMVLRYTGEGAFMYATAVELV